MTTCTHKVLDLTTLCTYIYEVDSYTLEEVLEAVYILYLTTPYLEDKAAKEATTLPHRQARGTTPSVQAERRATTIVA